MYRKTKEAPKPPVNQQAPRRLDSDYDDDDSFGEMNLDGGDDAIVSRVRHESVEDLTHMDERRRQRGQREENEKAVKRTPSAHESKTSELLRTYWDLIWISFNCDLSHT